MFNVMKFMTVASKATKINPVVGIIAMAGAAAAGAAIGAKAGKNKAANTSDEAEPVDNIVNNGVEVVTAVVDQEQVQAESEAPVESADEQVEQVEETAQEQPQAEAEVPTEAEEQVQTEEQPAQQEQYTIPIFNQATGVVYYQPVDKATYASYVAQQEQITAAAQQSAQVEENQSIPKVEGEVVSTPNNKNTSSKKKK